MDAVGEELQPLQPNRAERVLVGAAVAGLFAMAVLVTTNVVSRWIGRAIIPDDVLLVQELMVLVILLPIGAVTAMRQHISVDVFTERASPRVKGLLALFSHFVGLAFACFLLSAAWRSFYQAWGTQDYYRGFFNIPMWIGQFAFLFGVGLFLFRLVLMIRFDLRSLRQ